MKTVYFDDFDVDFVKSKNQDVKLPKNYKYEHKNVFFHIFSFFLYVFLVIWAFLYVKIYKKIKIRVNIVNSGLEAPIKPSSKNTCVCIYSNHTSAFQDVLVPYFYCFPKKPHIICSSANLGIPVIRKLLSAAGAIPIPDNIHKFREFNSAVAKVLKNNGNLIIYPEAHLWPGCDFIRPFEKAAFFYPAENHAPILTATTVYGKKTELLIDGPFISEEDKKHDRADELMQKAKTAMEKRVKNSHNNTIKYIKR